MKTASERFHKKYRKQQNGCWEWTAYTNSFGHGRFWFNNKLVVASRFSYELHNGLIPDGMFVCHKCDNSKCVNPEHLFVGTPKDNIKDCIDKHRNCPPPVHIGEGHHKAKLKNDDIIKIRNLYQAGGVSQRELARLFKISQPVVMKIVNRKLWKHIATED